MRMNKMKMVAAFNKDGSCGVLKPTAKEVLDELVDQTAKISDYTFFIVDVSQQYELILNPIKE